MASPNDRTGIFHTINGERREIVIEMPDPVQSAIFDSWKPARRLRAGREHSRFLRRMFRAQLRSLQPEWSEEDLTREIARRTPGDAVWDALVASRAVEPKSVQTQIERG